MIAAGYGKVLATMAPAIGLVGVAAALHFTEAGPIVNFIASALALASVAHVIGEATDHLGNHLSPAATGMFSRRSAISPNCSSASSRSGPDC